MWSQEVNVSWNNCLAAADFFLSWLLVVTNQSRFNVFSTDGKKYITQISILNFQIIYFNIIIWILRFELTVFDHIFLKWRSLALKGKQKTTVTKHTKIMFLGFWCVSKMILFFFLASTSANCCPWDLEGLSAFLKDFLFLQGNIGCTSWTGERPGNLALWHI